MMQVLSYSRDTDDQVTREPKADPAQVDTVLRASRSIVAVAVKSPDATAGETTVAQYRALQVLASRGLSRVADLAGALGMAPSTAGRMCDRA
jgi:DNA-binding MarR family transcriptional regulator